jgi:2,4-dienoyl-CoA reductase-like NADH-dependent reductase (Old Yellow Enzyme family)
MRRPQRQLVTLLFEPYDLSGLTLANRVVMAPMTRARSPDGIPDEQTALYYAQRAGAGLIVSEGAPVSQEGQGYLFNPGLYTTEQVAGWQRVTAAVHARGGKIYAQLWHVGRVSHTSLQPHQVPPISSTSTRAEHSCAYAYGEAGMPENIPASAPRALDTEEVDRVTWDFARSARLAIEAGFDGVELHAANGYLFDDTAALSRIGSDLFWRHSMPYLWRLASRGPDYVSLRLADSMTCCHMRTKQRPGLRLRKRSMLATSPMFI